MVSPKRDMIDAQSPWKLFHEGTLRYILMVLPHNQKQVIEPNESEEKEGGIDRHGLRAR